MGNRLYKIVHFEDLRWMPLIKGCDLASVDGDLNGEGAPFVLRLRWGMGETFDEAKLQAMNVGNFVSVPKEMRHFAMSKGETIVQVHGVLPFTANWVNQSEVQPPDAAPRATAKAKW